VHKPALDEMGIALYHEVAPHRPSGKDGPRKPSVDEMGPGVESVPRRKGERQERGTGPLTVAAKSSGPRSTTGKPGMRGGWKPRGR
jgi:excinuclease ABC subunit B